MKAGAVVAGVALLALAAGVVVVATSSKRPAQVEAGHRYRFFAFQRPPVSDQLAAALQGVLESMGATRVFVTNASDRTNFTWESDALETKRLPFRMTTPDGSELVVTSAEEVS